MLGTDEISASKHCIVAVKVKQGYFETVIFVVHSAIVF